MNDRDNIHRFSFEQFPVRGELVHLDATWQAVLDRGDYPPLIRSLLGELLAATALLASTLKYEGMLTVQLQGDGPLYLMVVQCSNEMAMRGLARWRGEPEPTQLRKLVGDGRLAITIEPASDTPLYQGIVPIDGDSLAECIQRYFEQSVQLPTRLWTASNEKTATGMLLQRLPGESDDEDAWNRLQHLADTLTGDEMLNLSDRDILRRLFHQEDVRLFEPRPVSFRCTCSKQRIENVLKTLGEKDIRTLLEEQGTVEVRCEFCNRKHDFDSVDIEQLFSSDIALPGSRSVH